MKRLLSVLPLTALAFVALACSDAPTAPVAGPQFHHKAGHGDTGGGAPKFHSATASIVTTGPNAGALRIQWDERGLGNENVSYDFSADFEATFACFNRGGKNPSAANKQTVSDGAAGDITLEVKNGRVQGDVQLGPPTPGTFSCPGGQVLRLADVTWFNIQLMDTTNGVEATFDPDEVSHVFFQV